ncbi:hypothetical protein [Piscinibacter sp.]|jgi:hypothetical protein|uniref:hypothetical protein n=1 Tax=Piscinibacter sp. TaxID=1903157 RepID=UPI00355A8969
MNQEAQDATQAAAAAASEAGYDLWLVRLQQSYVEDASKVPSTRPPLPLSDADKYRWIRANRGNFAIADALNNSDRDADFDAQIAAAMRTSAAGRHYYSHLHSLLG